MIVKTLDYLVTIFVVLKYSCYICCIKTFNKIILKTNSHEKINNILSYIFWFSIYIPFVSNYNGNNNKLIN